MPGYENKQVARYFNNPLKRRKNSNETQYYKTVHGQAVRMPLLLKNKNPPAGSDDIILFSGQYHSDPGTEQEK
jgi:hypothetical protein